MTDNADKRWQYVNEWRAQHQDRHDLQPGAEDYLSMRAYVLDRMRADDAERLRTNTVRSIPSIATDEAREMFTSFSRPEPHQLTSGQDRFGKTVETIRAQRVQDAFDAIEDAHAELDRTRKHVRGNRILSSLGATMATLAITFMVLTDSPIGIAPAFIGIVLAGYGALRIIIASEWADIRDNEKALLKAERKLRDALMQDGQ